MDRYKKVEQRITDAVKAVIANPNGETLYELLLCGNAAYKSGLGIPPEAVRQAIKEGLKKEKTGMLAVGDRVRDNSLDEYKATVMGTRGKEVKVSWDDEVQGHDWTTNSWWPEEDFVKLEGD